MNCRKRKIRFEMMSGFGFWLLETVEDGFLLKRENAIAKVNCVQGKELAIWGVFFFFRLLLKQKGAVQDWRNTEDYAES